MTPADFTAARKQLGLTQAGLAAVLGYSGQSRIAEIETGKRNPGPAVVRLMAAYAEGYRPHDWPHNELTRAQRIAHYQGLENSADRDPKW